MKAGKGPKINKPFKIIDFEHDKLSQFQVAVIINVVFIQILKGLFNKTLMIKLKNLQYLLQIIIDFYAITEIVKMLTLI